MKLCIFPLTTMIRTLCVDQASALGYTMNAPEDHLFGRPTSGDTIYEQEDPNVDRSKNIALIPSGFDSPTNYLPGSSTALTPNLVPGALEGGGPVSQTESITYPTVDSGGNWSGPSLTAVTSDFYYSGGYLGTLRTPAIGLSVKVYEGTDSRTLTKGAGHSPGTSAWDGNVCVADHNQGVRDGFGDLHTPRPGGTVTRTTKLGIKTYKVVPMKKVLETDTSGTTSTGDNQLTLCTCVKNQRTYHWRVTVVVKQCRLPISFDFPPKQWCGSECRPPLHRKWRKRI